MTDTILKVAVDDGYAQMKLYGDAPDAPSTFKNVFRTSIRQGREGLASMSGQGSINAYATEGQEFCISDRIAGEKTRFDDFHYSPMNRVLVQHALLAGGYQGRDIDLTVGLPVADYFRNQLLDNDRIQAKVDNLGKAVERTLGKAVEMPRIVRVNVGCQAVAAFIDFAYDDDLNDRYDIGERSVVIVDVGGRTTDIAAIVGGDNIDFSRSGTANIGALDVYQHLENSLVTEHGVRENMSTAVLARAAISGTMELFGEETDVSKLVETAKLDVQTRILREISQRIGNGAMDKFVVFVGGGAAMFPEISKKFRNGRTPEDPEFSNARGLWKYARSLAEPQAQAA